VENGEKSGKRNGRTCRTRTPRSRGARVGCCTRLCLAVVTCFCSGAAPMWAAKEAVRSVLLGQTGDRCAAAPVFALCPSHARSLRVSRWHEAHPSRTRRWQALKTTLPVVGNVLGERSFAFNKNCLQRRDYWRMLAIRSGRAHAACGTKTSVQRRQQNAGSGGEKNTQCCMRPA
jgi:hypothetical protein